MVALAVLAALVGCSLWAQSLPIPPRARSAIRAVTFSNQIVRIFQQHCQVCHHPGDIGPFSLMSYREAYPYAREIRRKTESREMPPWKPAPGHGEFQGERRLTPLEIELIARWVETGAPEGNPADLPPPLEFSDQWTLGAPDLVLEPDSAFSVAAEGGDVYRCFSIPMGLAQSRHITGVEVRPGNRSVAHHVLLYEDALGVSTRLVQPGDPLPGYKCFGGPGFTPTGLLGGWAPGNRPQVLPSGVGVRTTAGARMVMQVHYHPNGTAQSDRTRVGFFFARQPIQRDYLVLPLLNDTFVIPAGAQRHIVTASLTTPLAARALSITPHMHLLGREIKVEVVLPNGARQPLIYIDDWDFNWQDTYFFREPILITPFTRVELTAVYDNSAANPHNPNDPPRDVRWGDFTTDEMCLAFIGFTLN